MDKTHKKIMIIDDDISIVKMLALIIEKHQLGTVVGTLNSGEEAVEEVLFNRPDILLIDLLLPHSDGIQVIQKLTAKGYNGKCIMISQVKDEHMISLAYEKGSMFFVSKPIKAQEIISLLREVSRIIDLERSVSLIQSALMPFQSPVEETKPHKEPLLEVQKYLMEFYQLIGIANESGIKDFDEMILSIVKQKIKNTLYDYQLQELYEKNSNGLPVRTVEQRVRRLILKAFQNLSEIGYDDFYHPLFQEYGPMLFDFKQLKLEMRRIDNPDLPKGKINVKKFFDGLVIQIEKNILNY